MYQNLYYHAARAVEEREIAMASANPTVRGIHLEMANRYDALVEGGGHALLEMEERQRKAG